MIGERGIGLQLTQSEVIYPCTKETLPYSRTVCLREKKAFQVPGISV